MNAWRRSVGDTKALQVRIKLRALYLALVCWNDGWFAFVLGLCCHHVILPFLIGFTFCFLIRSADLCLLHSCVNAAFNANCGCWQD